MANEKNEFQLLAKMINGGIAGMIGTACVFPIDLVKTRLQNQRPGPNGEKQYTSILDAFKKIYNAEGFKGMYRGSPVAILWVTPEKAIKLAANDTFRHYLTPAEGAISLPRQILAGGLAGACQIIITTPSELIKMQLQNAGRLTAKAKAAGEVVEHLTARKFAARLIREHGPLGFYKGIGPTALRDITFSVVYFPLFAAINGLGPRRADGSGESVTWWNLVSGLLSGAFSALAVTPLDVIKTRIQMLNENASKDTCVTFAECVRTTYAQEGFRVFFNGGICRMMVLAPLFGIAQVVYLLHIGEKLLAYCKNFS